jgi:hypothetical protein
MPELCAMNIKTNKVMKRIILSLTVLIMATGAVFADDDKPITVEQLPPAAREFIADYFSDVKVAYAKMEDEFFESKSYEVVFTNGSKVEFDSKGEWKDVDCKFAQAPEGIVPQQITNYVSDNYPDAKIIGIDRDRRDYEVDLSNGLEMTFDLKFNLTEIDD